MIDNSNSVQQIPLVSIICNTYNHEKYIAQAIEGFLMQKTNFPFEILIHDDASTDGTTSIVKQYEAKYPDVIKPIYQKVNQYSQGIKPRTFQFPRAQGKYIALCEGDDYWTDPLKLQKQVDFLEENEEYVMCTHVAEEKNEILNKSHFFPNISQNTDKSIQDYILNNLTATCSLVLKRQDLPSFPDWFKKVPFGDLALILFILHKTKKKVMILKDCMGVYRVNAGGVHGFLKKDSSSLIKAYKLHLKFIDVIDKYLFNKKEYRQDVYRKKANTYHIIAKLSKKENRLLYLKYQTLYYTSLFQLKYSKK